MHLIEYPLKIIRLESQASNLTIKCEKLKDLLIKTNHAKNQLGNAKNELEQKRNILEIEKEFYKKLYLDLVEATQTKETKTH